MVHLAAFEHNLKRVKWTLFWMRKYWYFALMNVLLLHPSHHHISYMCILINNISNDSPPLFIFENDLFFSFFNILNYILLFLYLIPSERFIFFASLQILKKIKERLILLYFIDLILEIISLKLPIVVSFISVFLSQPLL